MHKNVYIIPELESTPVLLPAELEAHFDTFHEIELLTELTEALAPHVSPAGAFTSLGNGETIDEVQFEVFEKEEDHANN